MKISKPIVAALVFATLIIASAYFLKGNSAKSWIDAGIYLVGFYFFFRYTNAAKKCSTKNLVK
ncbi:MAG: hypothetical protein JWO92_870 [Chitinophagaceae bacterium]|nr:hypothetical protein [Chitinophagaceae bacterium]